MKLIITILVTALNAQASDIIFIKNSHADNYKTVEHLLAQKNELEAIQKLKRLLNTDKQNEIYVLDKLSKLYKANNLTERFVTLLHDKIKKAPFDVNFNHQLAVEYLAQQKPAEACDKAKFMLPHLANKVKFYNVLADCSFALNQPDEAITYLNILISNQSEPSFYLKRAALHLKLNNLPLAKADLDVYFAKAKPTEQAYLLQAELNTKQNLSDKQPELYKRCLTTLEVSPKCFLGYLNATKNIDANFKLEHFNRYLAAYQDYPAILTEIGHHYQLMKNYEQAEKMFLAASNKKPGNIEITSALFEFYNQLNESQKAFDVLSQFMNTAKNDDDIKTALNLQNSLFQKNTAAMTASVSPKSKSILPEPNKHLYASKKYNEILAHLKKIKTKSDAEYFLLGNIYYN